MAQNIQVPMLLPLSNLVLYRQALAYKSFSETCLYWRLYETWSCKVSAEPSQRFLLGLNFHTSVLVLIDKALIFGRVHITFCELLHNAVSK